MGLFTETRVVDVKLTERTIEKCRFTQGDCYKCPVATAVAEAFDCDCEVRVNETILVDCHDGWLWCAETPQAVRQWFSRFDSGERVSPATWTITFSSRHFPTGERTDPPVATLSQSALSPSHIDQSLPEGIPPS